MTTIDHKAAIDNEFRRGRTRAFGWAFPTFIVGFLVGAAAPFHIPTFLLFFLSGIPAVIVYYVKLRGSFNTDNVIREWERSGDVSASGPATPQYPTPERIEALYEAWEKEGQAGLQEALEKTTSASKIASLTTSETPLTFDGGYFLSDFYDPYLRNRRWMCISGMDKGTKWNPQVPATPKHPFISRNGELYQDVSDYGTLEVPPSDQAMTILCAMTEEEKLNLHDVLKELQVRTETITKTPGILLHPEKRASLWGKALAKMSDHYYEIGNQQRALFFMEAAWNLSKHPLFAVHTGLLKSRAGDLAQAKGLFENYLAEYRNVRSVAMNSVYPFIKEEQLEAVARSAREALAAISELMSQKN